MTLLSMSDGIDPRLPFLPPTLNNTMSVPPIGLFSPWKAPLGPYETDPRQIQEVVLYCTSRFHAAAITIANGRQRPAETLVPILFLGGTGACVTVDHCLD